MVSRLLGATEVSNEGSIQLVSLITAQLSRAVGFDALGCQTEITEKIISQQAEYMLAVKGNQGTLADDIADLYVGFEQAQ